MSKRMLIDARHSEETRVTIIKGSRIEDFDYESATKKQLKGNIYLARVTRVEPSLQAAFVEYGGNRHGFLAFSEIHPDYYQISAEEREALLAELIEEQRHYSDRRYGPPRRNTRRSNAHSTEGADEKSVNEAEKENTEVENVPAQIPGASPENEEGSQVTSPVSIDTAEAGTDAGTDAAGKVTVSVPHEGSLSQTSQETSQEEIQTFEATRAEKSVQETKTQEIEQQTSQSDETEVPDTAALQAPQNTQENSTEDFSDDGIDDDQDDDIRAQSHEAGLRRRAVRAMKRRYSIQEVIKKRQVLLIQVVKEERGNKGAALTTYLSLAGRYCVLMPNSTHSGGISRKISSALDRRRLKTIISDLSIPDDMGLIIRTAGTERTKVEIRRDYEYLVRLWNGIRELTLKSVAPCLVYEEADLIKRTIRDLYSRDIDEILVEGEKGYRNAKDFMKLLMPSHAKKVRHYRDHIPLFHRYQIEQSLESMYQPVVQLKSGGYIVINPTEALIAIDVNSGRSTKEHNIEETAVKTNLEAAEEIARQLKLRDMAGLIVVDFIDMEDRGNNRSVEKRMKDMLKTDRARVQVGRISSFGLLEMSRQRLRPNLLETSMEICTHCKGTGHIRSIEFASLSALRQLEEEGIRARSSLVSIEANPEVAIYLLNRKRDILTELENRYHYRIEVLANSDQRQGETILNREATDSLNAEVETSPALSADNFTAETWPEPAQPEPVSNKEQTVGASHTTRTDHRTDHRDSHRDDDDQSRRRHRKRRHRPTDREDSRGKAHHQPQHRESDDEGDVAKTSESVEQTVSGTEESKYDEDRFNKRRRGRRGGRRRKMNTDSPENAGSSEAENPDQIASPAADAIGVPASRVDHSEQKPRRTRRRRTVRPDASKPETATTKTSSESLDEITADSERSARTQDDDQTPKKPARRRVRRKPAEAKPASATPADDDVTSDQKTKSSDAVPDAVQSVSDSGVGVTKAKPKSRSRQARPVKSDSSKTGARPEKPINEPINNPVEKTGVTTIEKAASQPSTGNNPSGTVQEKASTERIISDKDKRKGWWQRTFG